MAQVYGLLLRAPVGNFILQQCENKNQFRESLAEFLLGNRAELYFASKFSKSRHFQQKTTSKLLAVPLEILSRRV